MIQKEDRDVFIGDEEAEGSGDDDDDSTGSAMESACGEGDAEHGTATPQYDRISGPAAVPRFGPKAPGDTRVDEVFADRERRSPRR